MYLKGFNFIEFLNRKLMLGQVDPWRRTDEGKPIMTLLVALSIAMDECKEWSGQDINKKEFLDYLKLNDVIVFHNIDEFQKLKEKNRAMVDTRPLKRKRVISPEHREKLREHMRNIRKSKTLPEIPSVSENSQ